MLKGGLAALSGADILKLLTPEQRAEIINDIDATEIPNVLPMAEIPFALAQYGSDAQWDMVKTLWHGLDLEYTNEVLVAEFGMMVVEVPEADSNVQPQNLNLTTDSEAMAAWLMDQHVENNIDLAPWLGEVINNLGSFGNVPDMEVTYDAITAYHMPSLMSPSDLLCQISESDTDADSYISELIRHVDNNAITGDLDYTIEALEGFCDGQMFTRDRCYNWDEIEDFVDTDEINTREEIVDNLCSDDICEWIRNNI
jgi:hypothetical protein